MALEERFAEAAAEKEVADKKQMEKEHYDANVAAAATVTKLKKPLTKITPAKLNSIIIKAQAQAKKKVNGHYDKLLAAAKSAYVATVPTTEYALSEFHEQSELQSVKLGGRLARWALGADVEEGPIKELSEEDRLAIQGEEFANDHMSNVQKHVKDIRT